MKMVATSKTRFSLGHNPHDLLGRRFHVVIGFTDLNAASSIPNSSCQYGLRK